MLWYYYFHIFNRCHCDEPNLHYPKLSAVLSPPPWLTSSSGLGRNVGTSDHFINNIIVTNGSVSDYSSHSHYCSVSSETSSPPPPLLSSILSKLVSLSTLPSWTSVPSVQHCWAGSNDWDGRECAEGINHNVVTALRAVTATHILCLQAAVSARNLIIWMNTFMDVYDVIAVTGQTTVTCVTTVTAVAAAATVTDIWRISELPSLCSPKIEPSWRMLMTPPSA